MVNILKKCVCWDRGCGLEDRACDPSSIPLGEKKENKGKEAGVGPLKKCVCYARSH